MNIIYKKSFALILFACLSIKSRGGNFIKGRIYDNSSKQPIASAVVTDGQPGNIDVTDINGNFFLKNLMGDSLIVFVVGYNTRVVKIASDTVISIWLERGAIELKDVTIINKATLKTYNALTGLDLNLQPVKSAQDLLRLVPGLFIAQHQGGGKAEQIFLRGFDADHGTDVNVSADGIPVNMVSHAHGQGYADLHFLIPETVSSYDFGKGPYYADEGDFTTAGYVAYSTKPSLDMSEVKIEVGQFNTLRMLAMLNLLSQKPKNKGQSAYIAGERLYSNGGPFLLPEHFNRYNLFGKFNTKIGDKNKLTFIASTMASGWRASGEIPNRAVSEGYILSRWGALDTSQGGYTTRTNISLNLSTDLGNNWTMDNQLWYSHYFFNLITNFTFYYYFPTTGDEFRQRDDRNLGGYNWKINKVQYVNDKTFTTHIGAGFRYDNIPTLELDHTENAQFLSYLQNGSAKELNINSYVDEALRMGNWLFYAGLRLDYFHFQYQNRAPDSNSYSSSIFISGIPDYRQKATVCPRISAEYTFNAQFQLYFKSGKGFHSNDARVVIANQGYQVLPAAYGADLGMNWKPIANLYISTALWYLYLQQEFTFGQDLIDQPGGPLQPSGKTERKGIDFSARYEIVEWLFATFNINPARPRCIDSPLGHQYLPLAPTLTSTAGLNFRFKNGLNGGISYRYLHDRAANSNYSLTALGYFITDLTAKYTRKKYEMGLSIENLFNVQWNESQFEYVSRLYYEKAPVDEVSYTPGVPFFTKFHISMFF